MAIKVKYHNYTLEQLRKLHIGQLQLIKKESAKRRMAEIGRPDAVKRAKVFNMKQIALNMEVTAILLGA